MFDKEVEEIYTLDMEEIEPSPSKGGKTRKKKPNRFAKEWMKFFPGSSNANVVEDQNFIDPYALCKDVICLGVISLELFKYFYHNRERKIPVCNPWKKNLAKLIFPKVFIDVDLMKALFQCYNLATKSFHNRDGTILFTLDWE